MNKLIIGVGVACLTVGVLAGGILASQSQVSAFRGWGGSQNRAAVPVQRVNNVGTCPRLQDGTCAGIANGTCGAVNGGTCNGTGSCARANGGCGGGCGRQ